MAAIFGPGGNNYSASDGPGGPFLRGDHPRRDSPLMEFFPPENRCLNVSFAESRVEDCLKGG